MKSPKVAEIYWLFKEYKTDLHVLGYIRDHHGGFFVIGGVTGSYYSGHNESWKKKWDEFLKLSFIPKEEAIKRKLIDTNWKPPKVSSKDQALIDKITNGIL